MWEEGAADGQGGKVKVRRRGGRARCPRGEETPEVQGWRRMADEMWRVHHAEATALEHAVHTTSLLDQVIPEYATACQHPSHGGGKGWAPLWLHQPHICTLAAGHLGSLTAASMLHHAPCRIMLLGVTCHTTEIPACGCACSQKDSSTDCQAGTSESTTLTTPQFSTPTLRLRL